MKKFYIQKSDNTPEVTLNPKTKSYTIVGNSFPTNPSKFYAPVIEWFNLYLNKTKNEEDITLLLHFNYINSSSSKQIAYLIDIISESKLANKITVDWCYFSEDIDIFETGERFDRLSSLKFNYCEIT